MADILIVDDAAFMRSALAFFIKKTSHSVVGAAADGDEALKLFKELQPDLVTLDILMPGKSGFDVLKEIMAEDPGAIVVMITALGQEAKEKEARELGARGYITKPFSQSEIEAELKRVLRASGRGAAA